MEDKEEGTVTQILSSLRFEPMTSCIHGKRLTARPLGLHGRD